MNRLVMIILAALLCLALGGCASTKLLDTDFEFESISSSVDGQIPGAPSGDEIDLANTAHLYANRWTGTAGNEAIEGQSLFMRPPPQEHLTYQVRFITSNGHDSTRDRTIAWDGRKHSTEPFDCRLGAFDDEDEFWYVLHLRFTQDALRVVDDGWKTVGPLTLGETHRVFISYQDQNTFSVTLTQPSQPQARYPANGFAPAYGYGSPVVQAADRLVLLCDYDQPRVDENEQKAYVLDNISIKQDKD